MPRKQIHAPLQGVAPEAAPALLPQSRQEFVGFVLFCLRKLAVNPDEEERCRVQNLFEVARRVVTPADSFPGWILNVGAACFSTLAAEGEMRAALRVLSEVEAIDEKIGGGILKTPRVHGRFAALRAAALKFAAGEAAAEAAK